MLIIIKSYEWNVAYVVAFEKQHSFRLFDASLQDAKVSEAMKRYAALIL